MKVAIIGASSVTAQTLVEILDMCSAKDIFFFGSSKSCGLRFKDIYYGAKLLDTAILDKQVLTLDALNRVDVAVSCIASEDGKEIEEYLLTKADFVVTNTKYHRCNKSYPMIVPGMNLDKVTLKSKLYTVPNCVVAGVALGLAPFEKYGMKSVKIVTLQSISGAGRNGLSAFEIHDNVLPHIQDEENKVECELAFLFPSLEVKARCYRVPVAVGHTIDIELKCNRTFSRAEIKSVLESYSSYIFVYESNNAPQPKKHSLLQNGMQVSIGNIKIYGNTIGFTLLTNNLMRGASGTVLAILQRIKALALSEKVDCT